MNNLDAKLSEKIYKDYQYVDKFYNESLKRLEQKINDNKEKVENIKKEEENMMIQIKNLEQEKNDINNKESNHVQNNLNFRLKNFSLERKIFNKENEIKRLTKELEWKKKMDEIEIKFLKEKNDSFVQDYEKLYNEKTKISEAIVAEVLKLQVSKIGDIIAANEIRKENDLIFANLINENK